MSRFNTPAPTSKTTNLAGGEAYTQSPELELVSILLTSFIKDQYYRSAGQGLNDLKAVIERVDPEFAAKAAVFARTEYGMRSVTHVTTAELFALNSDGKSRLSGKEWAKRFVERVVHRPDDATEILSYYLANVKGKALPAQLKKGLAASLTKFDAYQLGKYRSSGKSMSLVDVVNLVHPAHTDAIAKLVNDELRQENTWESKVSAAGKSENVEEAKAKAWADLVKERKIGYFALLRNLRNILEQSPDVVDAALEMLQDEKLIRKSLVLPFRYYSAYNQLREVSGSSKVLRAISNALDISLKNVPVLPGKTLVAIDHSGSMDSHMSDRSTATLFQIAALLGVALGKEQDGDVMYFGDLAKYYNLNPADSTLSMVETLDSFNQGYGYGNRSGTDVGHGTNLDAVFHEASKPYDRIVIVSDMQNWMSGRAANRALTDYKKRTGANPFVYAWDLAGYGTMQFPEPQVATLAGFSEKVFEVMKLVESDKQALVNKIKAIEL